MRITGTWRAGDDVDIWYGVQGAEDGPVLVLCDGIGCDGYIWPYLMDHFHDRITFVRWHYRGHGNSGEPDDPEALSIDHLIGDLAGILAHLTGEGVIRSPVVLVGHSMGCQLILEYAHQHPDDVQGLVLLCGSHGRPLDTFRNTGRFKGLIGPLARAASKLPDVADTLWSKLLPTRLSWALASRTELNADLVRRIDFMPYLQHMGRIRPATFLNMLSHAAEHTAKPHLPELDVPALVMAGEEDHFTPFWLSEEIVELIPDAELGVFPGGSHTAPLEMPELLNDTLERFLLDKGIIAEEQPQKPEQLKLQVG